LLVGVGVLAGLLWEPQVEGRNVNADQFTIYFAIRSSLTSTWGLFRSSSACIRRSKLLGYVGRGQAFSPSAIKALRHIKYCALAVIGFIVGGEVYIILGVSDDRAGGIAMASSRASPAS